ncbi:LysE family translocator [Streptomyces sp. VRA16 Mangrove soil]|uniref:LysE family translocator n=1 Tax=Streptomyces sp. VRA16 Mangrove soil TaxID=2817434 RepID=UPI001A9E20C7|nr:LysE family translocator [Streptomyces sp. VRA16 Mangrove soil]MBO1335513.1 LysE family translocator [Streptomyces sp. VRA16 Mangrove soil]
MLSTLLAFLGACTLIAASPGPSTVLIIKESLRSRRSGFLTVLGNETGVFVWGVCAAFGLSALLAASEAAYTVTRVVGALVLVVFGVQTLRAARRTKGEAGLDDPAQTPAKTGFASYRGGLLLNLANPKAAVFAMSFLPQFVPEGAPHLPAMVGLAALWAVYEVGYYGVYVWCVGRLRRVLSKAGVRRRLEQVSGGVLLLLGVRLALEG